MMTWFQYTIIDDVSLFYLALPCIVRGNGLEKLRSSLFDKMIHFSIISRCLNSRSQHVSPGLHVRMLEKKSTQRKGDQYEPLLYPETAVLGEQRLQVADGRRLSVRALVDYRLLLLN